jgi:hypothetical protein
LLAYRAIFGIAVFETHRSEIAYQGGGVPAADLRAREGNAEICAAETA